MTTGESKGQMVFALARNNGALRAFATAVDATCSCEGADVKKSMWHFFADDGSPLEARFERPGPQGKDTAVAHAYMLHRAMSGLWLQERLEQVRKIEGCGLTSVADLVELLKVNRGKRVAPRGNRR